MINLLVQPDDEIEIKFIVAEDNNGKVFADHNKEALIEILKHADYKMEEHKAVFKRPSFKDLLNLNQSIYGTGDGKISFNPMEDRYHKMTKLLKSWSLKNEKGEAIPATKDNLDKLSPVVVDIIAIQLETEIGGIYG